LQRERKNKKEEPIAGEKKASKLKS